MTHHESNTTFHTIELAPIEQETAQDVPPLEQLILKVHSRCDLACDNCYMYELADKTTWREQPRMGMSPYVVETTANRLAEHVTAHQQKVVDVIFHGGEALLKSPSFFYDTAKTFRGRVPLGTMINFSVQTNGTNLTQEYLEVFRERGIQVGLSLDGDKAANDRHRLFANGSSSYDHVMHAVDLLHKPRYEHLFSNVLAVIDLRNDPMDVYRALRDTGVRSIDFLLPLANWDNRPPGKADDVLTADYTNWLTPIFKDWLFTGRPIAIRSFESIINMVLGKESLVEGWGPDKNVSEMVIQSDGTIEQVDTLRSAYTGAAKTNRHIATTSIDQALQLEAFSRQRAGKESLSEICQACSHVDTCAGGYLPHRYRSENGFDNPSIYCQDNVALLDLVMKEVVLFSRRGYTDIGKLLMDTYATAKCLPFPVPSHQRSGSAFTIG